MVERDDWDDTAEEKPLTAQECGVTLDAYREWRAPRYGNANPQRMDNPVWDWLVRSRICAYRACREFDEPSAMEFGPGWCFQRFGQSSTTLPDGRVILVGGEHEDHYDPDFYIYNDVVVKHPDGRLEILGYSPVIFPPTDFHSATLVEGKLVLIGSLGYPSERTPLVTQVASLDLDSMAMSLIPTGGLSPGWIHDHQAILSGDGGSSLVTGGKVEPETPGVGLMENFDDWRLDLRTWKWERLTERYREVWHFRRSDGSRNTLWEMRHRLWTESMAGTEFYEGLTAEQKGVGPPPDKRALESLYRPELPHGVIAQDESEYSVWRVLVENVVTRFVEHSHVVEMIIEGELPSQTTSLLVADLTQKLFNLEGVTYDAKRVI